MKQTKTLKRLGRFKGDDFSIEDNQTIKTLWNWGFRSNAGWIFGLNANGTRRIIRSDPTNHLRSVKAIWAETKGSRTSWSQAKGHFPPRDYFLKDKRRRDFCNGSWLEVNSEFATITPERKNTKLILMKRFHNRLQRRQRKTPMVQSSCSPYGDTRWVYNELLIQVKTTINAFQLCFARKTVRNDREA